MSAPRGGSLSKGLTIGAEQVIQRDAEYVDRRCEGLARPVPFVQEARHLVPVVEVGLGEELGEDDDVVEGDGHAAARERVPHVPRVAEEDDAFLRVLAALHDRGKEGVGHAPDAIFVECVVDGHVEGCGELGNDVAEDVSLSEDEP